MRELLPDFSALPLQWLQFISKSRVLAIAYVPHQTYCLPPLLRAIPPTCQWVWEGDRGVSNQDLCSGSPPGWTATFKSGLRSHLLNEPILITLVHVGKLSLQTCSLSNILSLLHHTHSITLRLFLPTISFTYVLGLCWSLSPPPTTCKGLCCVSFICFPNT